MTDEGLKFARDVIKSWLKEQYKDERAVMAIDSEDGRFWIIHEGDTFTLPKSKGKVK